jgi:hypothetical protein
MALIKGGRYLRSPRLLVDLSLRTHFWIKKAILIFEIPTLGESRATFFPEPIATIDE